MTFPGGSQGNCPPNPQLRDPAQPHSSGRHALKSSREFPADGKTHSPSGSGFVGVFPLGYFYLLDKKVEVYCALCIIKHNMIHIYPERRVLSGLCLVTGGNGGGSPFSWKLTATFPFEVSILVFLFHPESSLMNLPTFVQISTCDLTWLKKATDKKFKTELRLKAKIKTFLT